MPPVQSLASLLPGVPEWPSLPLTKPIWNGLTPTRSCWRSPSRSPPRSVAQRIWPVEPVAEPETCWNAWVATISKSAKASCGDSAGVVSDEPLLWNISASGSQSARRRA